MDLYKASSKLETGTQNSKVNAAACSDYKPEAGLDLTAVVCAALIFARECQVSKVVETDTGIV